MFNDVFKLLYLCFVTDFLQWMDSAESSVLCFWTCDLSRWLLLDCNIMICLPYKRVRRLCNHHGPEESESVRLRSHLSVSYPMIDQYSLNQKQGRHDPSFMWRNVVKASAAKPTLSNSCRRLISSSLWKSYMYALIFASKWFCQCAFVSPVVVALTLVPILFCGRRVEWTHFWVWLAPKSEECSCELRLKIWTPARLV